MYRMHLNFRKEVYISVGDTKINYIGVLILYSQHVGEVPEGVVKHIQRKLFTQCNII